MRSSGSRKMSNYCRLCLRNETVMINIITSELKYSHLNIIEFLYWIFDVEVNISDIYSKLICQRCINIIQEVEYYRETFKKYQLILREKIDDLGSTCTNGINNWIFCGTSLENGIKSLSTETENISIPIVSITRLENSIALKKYYKVSDLTYKKKLSEACKDSDNCLKKSRSIGTSTEDMEDDTIRVSIEAFKNCIYPSLSISKLEDTTIVKEYKKIDNTTYRKMPHKFDGSPNHMQSELRRLKFIEHYYRTPTTALQELIKKKYEDDIPKIDITEKTLVPDSCEPLINIQEIRHVQVCDYCSKSFTSYKLLMVHCKTQHKKIRKYIDEENKCKLTGINKYKRYPISISSNREINISQQTQNLTNNKSNNPQISKAFLTKLKLKWDNISDLITIHKRKETVAPNNDLFPNLRYIKEQSENDQLATNIDSNLSKNMHKAEENIHINGGTEKKVVECGTEIVSEKKRKDISIIQHIVIQKSTLEQDLGNIEKDNVMINKDSNDSNEIDNLHCQEKDTFCEIIENETPLMKDLGNMENDNFIFNKDRSNENDNLHCQQKDTFCEIIENETPSVKDQGNMEKDDFIFNKDRSNENDNLHCQQKDTFCEIIENETSTAKENNISVNRESEDQLYTSKMHNLQSLRSAKYLWEKTINDIRAIQDSESQDQIHESFKKKSSNLMLDSQQNIGMDIIHNENHLSKENKQLKEKLTENKNHVNEVGSFVDELENNIFFFNRKGELDTNLHHNLNELRENKNNSEIEDKRSSFIQPRHLQSLLKKKNAINDLKIHMQKTVTEPECYSQNIPIYRDIAVNVNNEVSINLSESTDESRCNEIIELVPETKNVQSNSEENLSISKESYRDVAVKAVDNKISTHFSESTDEGRNSKTVKIYNNSVQFFCEASESRAETENIQINSGEKLSISKKSYRGVQVKAADNEVSINLSKSAYESRSNKIVKVDNNAIQFFCEVPEPRVETENIKNNSEEKLSAIKSRINEAQQPKEKIGFEIINRNWEDRLNEQPYCKQTKLSKNYCKTSTESSKESKNYKPTSIHDWQLKNVAKTQNPKEESLQHQKIKSSSKPKRRKKKQRRKSNMYSQVDKRIKEVTALFGRMNVGGNNPDANRAVSDDHSYAVKISNKCNYMRNIMKASPIEESICYSTAPPASRLDYVEKMEKLCKPCSVVVEKLDTQVLEIPLAIKEIPQISTINII